MSSKQTPASTRVGPTVPDQVTILRFDARRDDWDVQTAKRLERLLHLGTDGCWFINPIASVWSPSCSKEWHSTATKIHREWCRKYRRRFGNFVADRVKNFVHPDAEPVLAKLSRDEARHVRFSLKQILFKGVTFRDGEQTELAKLTPCKLLGSAVQRCLSNSD